MHNVWTQDLFGRQRRNDWSHKEAGAFEGICMTFGAGPKIRKWVFKQVIGKPTYMLFTSGAIATKHRGSSCRGRPLSLRGLMLEGSISFGC